MQDLAGCHVLVVEDEYLIADDLGQHLRSHGAILLGPVPSLERALAIVHTEERIDGAAVDINLRGKVAFSVADALVERDVPFVFATGYEAHVITDRYRHVPTWGKPYSVEALVRLLPSIIHQS